MRRSDHARRGTKREIAATASALLAIVTLGAWGPARAADADPATIAPTHGGDVDALMERLRSIPGLQARFTETKTIGLLAVPLVNEGTLYFDPPGRLLRVVDKPHPGRVLLVGDSVWLREDGRSEHIDLGAHPTARSFVGSFGSLLAGDRAALDRHFELTLRNGDDDTWTLDLRPRTEAMARIVTKMRVSGHREIVDRLVVVEASGDVSDTRFHDVNARRRYTDDEAARLFQPPR